MPSFNLLRKTQNPGNQVVAIQLKSNVRMPGGLDRKSGMSWMAAVCIGEKVTGWCGGRRREKTCRPRHKREESALNITELRSNDDDIQGRGAWSFRPPAYNTVRGMSGVCGFAWEKCPEFVGKRFTFPVGPAWGVEMAVPAGDLSSVAFEKCLITKQMQNGAEDRGTRKPSKCPESATPVLGPICVCI